MAGELSGPARRHCETSGFVAAPAPTGDYGIDVHIETGLTGLGSGDLLAAVQDMMVTPLWMSLVWLVHALVVMLEWAFTIDLLDSPAASGVSRALQRMQAAITEPWLVLALATASALAAYNGLLRRRVAETLGQAVVMVAMMAGGLWLIAEPTGTVGALGAWANRAAIGTLAVTVRGTPAHPGQALADSMQAVYSLAIEGPWCYLEFGAVDWCSDPAQLDPKLREAGLQIAAGERSLVGCRSTQTLIAPCAPSGSAEAGTLQRGAELLKEARSNGAIFLALPANGPGRNSISAQGSLLQAICRSPDETRCEGPTASQAEFRTDSGTWSRVGGLLLITVGVLGMVLLLGFIAVRLLSAATLGLLCLLLAPGMVLAPAFGEGGRALFRRWVSRLIGAVVAKLLFSFLLGVVLAVEGILASMVALGWWTQWLLMSAFWWGAYLHRHEALGLTGGALSREHHRPVRFLPGRLSGALRPHRVLLGAGRRLGDAGSGPPEVTRRPRRSPAGAPTAGGPGPLAADPPPRSESNAGGAEGTASEHRLEGEHVGVQEPESSVLRDAREVAAGRKKYLGIGRP